MQLLIEPTIHLELLEVRHIPALYELSEANRMHLSKWMTWVDLMQSAEFIEDYIKGSMKRNQEGLEFAFVILENNKIVGRIGLYKIDKRNKIGEIGYWLGEAHQGKGLILKSCKKLIDFAFTTLGLNRLEIKCAEGNFKSQKIPQLLNFTQEAILRKAERHKEEYVDLKLYALLSADWLK
jgi:ribosomal-protein-serine acetyltransferase